MSTELNSKEFKSPTHLVLSFLFRHKRSLAVLVVLWLVAAALATAQPLIMAPMVQVALQQTNVLDTPTGADISLANVDLNNIDQYVSNFLQLGQLQPWDIVLMLSGIFLAVVIVGTLLETLAFYIFTKVRVNTLRSLQEYVFKHLLSLSLDFFNQQRSGGLVSRLEQDAAASVNNFSNILKLATTAPVMAVIYGLMLVRTNLQLMLLVSLIAAIQWTAARLMRNQIRKYVTAEFDLIAMVNAYLTEIFQNIRVVKSFVAEKFEQTQLGAKFEQMIPVHVNRALSKHWQEPIVTMINAIGNVSILLLSTRELLNGNLTVVGFFLFLYVGRAMIQPISQIGQIYLSYQEMSASAARVYEILKLQPSIKSGTQPVGEFKEGIRFNKVSFSYGDQDVLSEVDIEIGRGQTVALVGPSGAGKSTFTDLLLRFYDPTGGVITIDGKDLRDIQTESYRRLFGVVAQESLLFNETLTNNIAYGRDGISQAQIEAAAEVANAAEFIEAMPKGYQTFVGDRGIRLSGGQRQRIAIARAVVHQPEILILDEATSSLDTESERLGQTAIDNVVQGRTSVVIAHRLS
ncbi:MAG: ABC transporter ATP-binding protein, partial [Sideroxyarcus sp.]|nr:ABC transporter ATP-binding protein [Sideroxyarcus sp.]